MAVAPWFEDLLWRGLIADTSDREALCKLAPGTPFYWGCDPTAASLHHGNLVGLVMVARLAAAGFKPILLFGGATGLIGDPSGRSTERPLNEAELIAQNVAALSSSVRRMLTRLQLEASYVNNLDWTANLSTIEFLRDIGKHFSVNVMLHKDSVQTRLNGDGISFTEFSYMILQAFDFMHLYKNQGCRLQMGGSDQWGNMTAGMDLIRKSLQGEAHVLSFPLITDSEGRKFGKSTGGGAIWLDEKLFSAYEFHQFWLNVADTEVAKCLRVFTLIPRAEIEALEVAHKAAPEKRIAQQALADAVTTFVHGQEATETAKRSAKVLFGGSLAGLSDAELLAIFQAVPSVSVTRSRAAQMSGADLFTEAKLAASKGEAKRLIQGGGAVVHDIRVSDPTAAIGGLVNLSERQVLVIRSGKKNYALVKLQDGEAQ